MRKILGRQFHIELINKIRKPDTGNVFVNGALQFLSIILYPIVLLVGFFIMLFVIMVSVFQRLTSTKAQREADKINDQQAQTIETHWTILTEQNGIKLYQQYVGDFRFGPAYFKLKSNPSIALLSDNFFGDWFFNYRDGIFLQQFNSTTKADTNLIFVDSNNLETKVIAENIPSLFWNIVETTDNTLELVCDTGKETLRYKIEMTN